MVNLNEIGQEKTDGMFIEKLIKILQCVEIFLVKMAVWIAIGDTRHRHGKLMMSHRLALKLIEKGSYTLRDILWYKKNNVSSSSKDNLAQPYETILFFFFIKE